MKTQRKRMLLLGAVAVLALAAVVALLRHRGGDLNGVSTYPDKNAIIMNAYRDGTPYASGTGMIVVGEGEHLHVEYALQEGSFDVAFTPTVDSVLGAVMDAEPLASQPEAWQDYEARMAADDGSVGRGGVEGKGSLDFAARPGTWTGCFYPHDMEGTVTVTAQKD